jgi:ankyrin repeat protein
MLMISAYVGARMEIIQLLLDSGVENRINDQDPVAHLRFNLEWCQSTVLALCSVVILSSSPVCHECYLTFTPFLVQNGQTVLMMAAVARASKEIMELLLDSGAGRSINAKDRVSYVPFNLKWCM